MKKRYDCHLEDGGAYDAWHKNFKSRPQAAMAELDSNANAEAIKQCHDTHLTFEAWRKVYNTWRKGLSVYGGKGWNQNTRAIACMSISATNIFTNKCNDMPDWRHPDNVKEDIAAIKKGNARWVDNAK